MLDNPILHYYVAMRTVAIVPGCNKSLLDERVARLNSICDKLGLARIDYRVISTEFRSYGDGSYMKWYTVEIIGESPIISGWRFVAQIEHGKSGNVIRNLSDLPMPDMYRAVSANCEHCQQDRARRVTYILQDDDGVYKQVGSTCLSDFTGHDNPHDIADYLQSLNALAGDLSEPRDYDMYSGDHTLVNSVEFLSLVSAIIRVHGWVGKAHAMEQGLTSTWERAVTRDNRVEVTQADKALASAALAWGAEQDGRSEYEHNLRRLCSGEYCTWRNTGLLASAIVAYRKSRAEDVTGKPTGVSEYIGAVGDKIVADVTVVSVKEINGAYGLTSVVNMMSGGHNAMVWFSSGKTALEIGKSYQIRGTVKKNDVYNGIKQTVVTRCKVV